jgi:hypothetical protein
MTGTARESGKFVLLLRPIEDKKVRYLVTKKLAELWPTTSFSDWKAKTEKLEVLVLMRADNRAAMTGFMEKLTAVGAPIEVVEQSSIGGSRIY